jgi:DNA-binding response OmpR family regulator
MKGSEAAILLVDDERDITDLITLYLQREGYTVHTADNGEDALRIAKTLLPDLIVLDVNLGQDDGIAVCRELRSSECSNIPIIFLSCKNEDHDMIRGLSEGGDDYITKPFSPSLLVARIQAHIRRRRTREGITGDQAASLCFPGLEINFRSLEVRLEGELVPLSAKEFELLSVLARQPNRVFPLEELFRRVWQTDSMGDTRTLMVHISNLRKKLELEPSRPRWVQTVRGFGYRFSPSASSE